jgi:predicted HTH domain antitoxin
MCQITVEIPDHSLHALNVDRQHAAAELQFLAAVKLFELRKLSSGGAAELAGIPKPLFLERLKQLGVPAVLVDQEYIDHDSILGRRD